MSVFYQAHGFPKACNEEEHMAALSGEQRSSSPFLMRLSAPPLALGRILTVYSSLWAGWSSFCCTSPDKWWGGGGVWYPLLCLDFAFFFKISHWTRQKTCRGVTEDAERRRGTEETQMPLRRRWLLVMLHGGGGVGVGGSGGGGVTEPLNILHHWVVLQPSGFTRQTPSPLMILQNNTSVRWANTSDVFQHLKYQQRCKTCNFNKLQYLTMLELELLAAPRTTTVVPTLELHALVTSSERVWKQKSLKDKHQCNWWGTQSWGRASSSALTVKVKQRRTGSFSTVQKGREDNRRHRLFEPYRTSLLGRFRKQHTHTHTRSSWSV